MGEEQVSAAEKLQFLALFKYFSTTQGRVEDGRLVSPPRQARLLVWDFDKTIAFDHVYSSFTPFVKTQASLIEDEALGIRLINYATQKSTFEYGRFRDFPNHDDGAVPPVANDPEDAEQLDDLLREYARQFLSEDSLNRWSSAPKPQGGAKRTLKDVYADFDLFRYFVDMATKMGIHLAVASYGCRFLIEAFLQQAGFANFLACAEGQSCHGAGAAKKRGINIVVPDLVGAKSTFEPHLSKVFRKGRPDQKFVKDLHGTVLGTELGAEGKPVLVRWLLERSGIEGVTMEQVCFFEDSGDNMAASVREGMTFFFNAKSVGGSKGKPFERSSLEEWIKADKHDATNARGRSIRRKAAAR